MGGASELEVAHLIPLLDSTPDIDCVDTAGHFGHADTDDGHLTNLFVVRLDDEYLAGGHRSQERLAFCLTQWIIANELGLIKVVIGVDLIDIFNGPIDGRVPPVIGKGA